MHINGVAHPAEPGTAVYVPANAWHYVTNTGTESLRLVFVSAVDGFGDVVYEYPEPVMPAD